MFCAFIVFESGLNLLNFRKVFNNFNFSSLDTTCHRFKSKANQPFSNNFAFDRRQKKEKLTPLSANENLVICPLHYNQTNIALP